MNNEPQQAGPTAAERAMLQAVFHPIGSFIEADLLRLLREHIAAAVSEATRELRRELRCPIGLDTSRDICSAGTCPACLRDHLVDAQRQLAEAQADNPHLRRLNERLTRELAASQAAEKRLRKVAQLALDAHGAALMSNPPKDAWVYYRVAEKLRAALAAARKETL